MQKRTINRLSMPVYWMKGFQVFVVLLLILYSGASSAQAEDRMVRVGVYENPPKIFTAPSGKPAGIFIDILESIAAQEGWTLQYVSGTWAEGLARLEQGQIDIMPDVAYTTERGERFSFHKSQVLSSWFQAYARQGSGIQSILDLNGKRVAILEKSVQEEAFTRFSRGFGLNIELVFVKDYQAMFELVAAGHADAGVTNQFYGALHAKKYGLVDTAVVFEPSALFYASTKDAHLPVLNAIDRHVTEMRKDLSSVYYRSIKRWTSEEVRFQLPTWLKIFGLAVVAILIMSLLGSIILRRQVNARTRELRQINQEMEQRILERTAELADAMQKAQAADQLKSAFLATMSHELRTPLNSIIGFTGILLQQLAGPLNDEQRKQLTMVQGSSRHLLSLINDVLDISKIEAGQLVLSFTSFDLRSLIEKTGRLVLPLAEKNVIELRMDISDDVQSIVSDQRRLEQVILNLLNNALKFTEKGHVLVSCRLQGDNYLLSVSDTGIGMKPEEIPNLFQPFHQIDSGLTRKREGTGLGLSICRKIIDIMGGSITVESTWGQGSSFVVSIPVRQGDWL